MIKADPFQVAVYLHGTMVRSQEYSGCMRDPIGFMEPGKKHSQVHLDGPGLCPLCLERDIDGREGGAKTQLVEEMVDGVKTGKWICPDGGRSYVEQGGGGAWRAPIFPPI